MAELAGAQRRWLLRSDDRQRPLTINAIASMNRFEWAASTKATRMVWAALARKAKIPKELPLVDIEVYPLHVDGRSPQDTSACAPAAKAAIDGLRDAGCLIDDTQAYVRFVRYWPPKVVGVDGLELMLVEVL